MDTYSFLRQLADSWVLLAMFGFFIAMIAFVFRPGSTATYDDVAQIPLRDEKAPKSRKAGDSSTLKGADHV